MSDGASKIRLPLKFRIVNAIAGALERAGILRVHINPERLMAQHRWLAGREFQDQQFVAPMKVLAESLNNEAKLHPAGRFAMIFLFRTMLKTRLCLEAAAEENPEAIGAEVRRPLYVIGLPRTGTTLLYNLLCQDPNCRPLMGWESFFPAPPLSKRGRRPADRRKRNAMRLVDRMHRMSPQLKAIHELVADGPEECTWLLHSTFTSPGMLVQARIPTYERFLKDLPRDAWRHVYTEYARALKLLQHDSPGDHWVLKSPAHQMGLDGLLDVIPNACIVQTHRDLRKVIPSCCSLFAVVCNICSDQVRDEELGAEVLEYLRMAGARAMAAQDERPQNIFDVRFEELVADPIATVRRIYERFEYSYDPRMEAGMQRWLAENPQGKHGVHKYDLAQFGLSEDQVLSAFDEYQRRYAVPMQK